MTCLQLCVLFNFQICGTGFPPQAMLKLSESVKGHFVTLIEIDMHRIACSRGDINT